jgi:hypothetical protein
MTEDFELEACDYIDWDEGRDFPAASAQDDDEEANEEEPAIMADREPKAGDRIAVSGGARAFTGVVVGADELLLIVAEAPGRLTYLRRNVASTDPHTWRCAGQAVRVEIVTRAVTRASQQTFSKALKDLERKTR